MVQAKAVMDQLAMNAFGMTRSEAHEKGVCIMCKKTPMLRNREDAEEYKISALCGTCFDSILGGDEDATGTKS